MAKPLLQQFQNARCSALNMALSLLGCWALGTEARAQDYVALQEDGTLLGDLAASVRSCRHFGYETDGQEVTSIAEARVRRAIMDGIDGGTASTLIVDAIRRKAADLDALSAGLQDTSNPERWARYLGEFMADWVSRCEEMSERFPTAIIADGDEEAVTSAFHDRMRQILEGGE